jgi:hypothetical protein
MRLLCATFLLAGLAAAGCGQKSAFESYEGPKVDAFTGRLTHLGKPVSFPSGEEVSLQLFHEKGTSLGVPIQPDGTFKLGWMPTGKYSAMLNRNSKTGKGPPRKYSVPGGLNIEPGKTEYTIELGKGWKS